MAIAFKAFQSSNFTPFMPFGFQAHGDPDAPQGVMGAAAVIFFAFIGFDAISTGSEEARDPKRDLPLAIIGSLLICTVFYVLTALGAVGIATPEVLSGSDAPLAAALDEGAGIGWAAAVLAFGAVIAITSVILVILYGQSRIFFAMCRDGLLPRRLAKVHPRYGTPARLTLMLGTLIAFLAALIPLSEIVKLVNIGTLFAFVLVNIGVIILRRTRPDLPRSYKVPFSPWFPLLGIGFAVYLMADLPLETWIRFVVWLLVGLVIYAVYGFRRSRVGVAVARGRETQPPVDGT
jgi:APA family basic amino acid/polyamine antiporter